MPEAVKQAPAPQYATSHQVLGGRIITESQLARYNALCKQWGHAKYPNGTPIFIPPIDPGYGVTRRSDGIFITGEAAENFRVMSRLAKSAIK